MRTQSQFQSIYDEAYSYLLSFDEVDEVLIEKYLELGEVQEPETLEELYRGLLVAIQNRQGMSNSIGDIGKLRNLLYDFRPNEVADEYESWEELFRAVERDEAVSPPGPLDIENKRSHWVQYSKSVLSGAEFLKQFDDIYEFSEFVANFETSEYTRYSLPLLLEEQIHGLGFALACDFLKENGYPEFVKPDTHLKDLFTGLELSDSTSDFEIFLDIIRFAETIDEVPYRVDKLFWLIGSGRFYLEEPELRISTNKDNFIHRIKEN